MFFKMFPKMTGWQRAPVMSLLLVMYFGLAFFMGSELDNYLLPSRAAHPESVWPFIAIAFVAGALIAWITRTFSFVWPTFLFATSIVLVIQSFQLFAGIEFPEHRVLDALAGVICVAVYWAVLGLAYRFVKRDKKTSVATKVTAE